MSTRAEIELSEWFTKAERELRQTLAKKGEYTVGQMLIPPHLVVRCWYYQQRRIYKLEQKLKEAEERLYNIIKRRLGK